MNVPTQQPSPASFPPAPVAGRTSLGGVLGVVLGIAVLFAVAGISFFAGSQTAPAPQTIVDGFSRVGAQGPGGPGNGLGGGTAGGSGGGQGGLGRFGGVTIEGTITAITADSLTLTLLNGQTITIPLSTATTYHRQAAAANGDISAGTSVLVRLAPRAQSGAGAGPSQAPSTGVAPSGLPGFRLGPAADVTIVAK